MRELTRSGAPAVEVIGIDHLYVAVSDLNRSEAFYDRVFPCLGFRKNEFTIANERHIQYFNRLFGYVLRPARSNTAHDPYAPGIHHFCLRVDSMADVETAAKVLRAAGVAIGEPRAFPEYAPDYFAFFLNDPDGLRLEVTNYRAERRARFEDWESVC